MVELWWNCSELVVEWWQSDGGGVFVVFVLVEWV